MRLRNIPGAQDAILESPYVVQEPQTKKGHWGEVFVKKQPLHIEVGLSLIHILGRPVSRVWVLPKDIPSVPSKTWIKALSS